MLHNTATRVAISQSELFSAWPQDALARLIQAADVMVVKPGTRIHGAGDAASHLYLVAAGSMIFSRIPAAHRPFTMGRHVAGDFHGLGPVLNQTSFVHDAICREQTMLVRIPGAVLRQLVAQDGKLSFSLFAALERRHLRARDLYVSASVSSMRARIADLLRSLSLRSNAGRYSAQISLSQDEIAAMLGTRRQVVNRMLRDMVTEGVVEVRYGRIEILDFEALNLMSEDSFVCASPAREADDEEGSA